MRIISWNIRCQNGGDDARGCGWKVRLPLVIATLRELSPDIFAVQEAHGSQMDDLRAAFSDYQSVGMGREDGENDGEHCGIFFDKTRFWLRSQETRWLSPTPDVPSRGWGANYTRIVTRASLLDRETDRKLMVWNAHLDHQSELARLESARILRGELAKAEVPALLCGDFNCAPDAAPIAELIASGTLRDARAHAANVEGEVATFCGFDEPVRDESRRIDYVFATRDWNIESYRVPDDKASWPPASDHRPVIVELNSVLS